jgi:hypothetical protein
MKTRTITLALVTATLVLGAAGSFAAPSRTSVAAAPCKTKLVGSLTKYCGPASAQVSVFPGVTFKNGTCHKVALNGGPALSLGLGVQDRTNVNTNNGQPFFALTISGAPSHPTGGGVLVYWKSKHWSGRGVSFKGNANGGSFVLAGIKGSRGTATGSFHC